MDKFLTIAIVVVIMSLLSCSSGFIGTLAAGLLPLVAVVGVGLMTINMVVNGQNQNVLAGGVQNDHAIFGACINALGYFADFARGLFVGVGRLAGWVMPDVVVLGGPLGARGAGPAPGPVQVPVPGVAAQQPQQAAPQLQGAAQPQGGLIRLEIHVFVHGEHRNDVRAHFPVDPPVQRGRARDRGMNSHQSRPRARSLGS